MHWAGSQLAPSSTFYYSLTAVKMLSALLRCTSISNLCSRQRIFVLRQITSEIRLPISDKKTAVDSQYTPAVSTAKDSNLVLALMPRTHWSVTIRVCQLSDWQLLVSCIFSSNWILCFGWKLLLLLLLPILLPKIHEIKSCQSLNWQKLTVIHQCVRGFI